MKKTKRVLVRKDVVDFLQGAAPLDGVWFGDSPEGKPHYWWRRYLDRKPAPRSAKP